MPGIEKLFVVEATYTEDAANARAPFREEHLSRARELRADGRIALVGAFEDLSGSLVVYRVPDEAAVRELVEADVYWRNGVWVDYRVRPCNVITD